MLNTNEPKKISAVAYITIQADMAAKEGPVSPRLADLFFQCAQVRGERTIEDWDKLVIAAREDADLTIEDVLKFGEDAADENADEAEANG